MANKSQWISKENYYVVLKKQQNIKTKKQETWKSSSNEAS